jgi:hypothetical protein
VSGRIRFAGHVDLPEMSCRINSRSSRLRIKSPDSLYHTVRYFGVGSLISRMPMLAPMDDAIDLAPFKPNHRGVQRGWLVNSPLTTPIW